MTFEKDQFSNDIIDEIETLLPQIISSMKVEKTSIKKEELKEKLRMKRLRKGSIRGSKKLIELKKDHFGMKQIKGRLTLNNMRYSETRTNFFINPYMSDSNILYSPKFSFDKNFNNGHHLPDKTFPHIKPMPSALQKEIEKQGECQNQNNVKITDTLFDGLLGNLKIHDRLKQQMTKNDILSTVIHHVNNEIIELMKNYHLDMDVLVDCKKDIEFDDWEKIYYRFFFNEDNINIKFEIWDLLDDFIRSRINEQKEKKYKKGSKARTIDQINQQIYIDINM